MPEMSQERGGITPMSQIESEVTRTFQPDTRSFWWKRVCTQNPFYLISGACFIHSLKFATGGEAGPLSLYPRLILIGCYLLTMVITALVLVRRYKLWDDTRSLLLIVLLLFCELNLGFDELLATQFARGAIGDCGALLTIVLISELLFRGLPLKFPGIYRVPYYLLWSAISLWPIASQAAGATFNLDAARWTIAAFSPLCAMLLLTLIPAARVGRSGIEPSGTPWPWPLHPWTVFFFLILAVVFRLNALCVSFDSATDFGAVQAYALLNIFSPWLLIPLLLAISQLVLERALVKQAIAGQSLACLMALMCIPLGLSAGSGNEVSMTFVNDVTHTLGSPAWLALMGCLAFHVLALARGARPAFAGLLTSLTIASFVSPQTVAFDQMGEFTSIGLWIAAALAIARGVWRKQDELVFVAGVLAIAALRVDSVITSELLAEPFATIPWWFIDGHLLVGWMLVLAIWTKNDTSKLFCTLASMLLLPLVLIAILSLYPPWWILAYVAGLGVMSGLFGWWKQSDSLVVATGLMSLYVALRGSWLGYWWAVQVLHWDGIHWLAGAVVLFLIGLGTSLSKTRQSTVVSSS